MQAPPVAPKPEDFPNIDNFPDMDPISGPGEIPKEENMFMPDGSKMESAQPKIDLAPPSQAKPSIPEATNMTLEKSAPKPKPVEVMKAPAPKQNELPSALSKEEELLIPTPRPSSWREPQSLQWIILNL